MDMRLDLVLRSWWHRCGLSLLVIVPFACSTTRSSGKAHVELLNATTPNMWRDDELLVSTHQVGSTLRYIASPSKLGWRRQNPVKLNKWRAANTIPTEVECMPVIAVAHGWFARGLGASEC